MWGRPILDRSRMGLPHDQWASPTIEKGPPHPPLPVASGAGVTVECYGWGGGERREEGMRGSPLASGSRRGARARFGPAPGTGGAGARAPRHRRCRGAPRCRPSARTGGAGAGLRPAPARWCTVRTCTVCTVAAWRGGRPDRGGFLGATKHAASGRRAAQRGKGGGVEGLPGGNKTCSIWPSHPVPDGSTTQTRPSLTSLFGWEAVTLGDVAACDDDSTSMH